MTENTNFFEITKKKEKKILSPDFIYAKLVFIMAFAYAFSFAIGCVIFHILDFHNSDTINQRIISYFSVNFSDCKNISDFTNLILKISRIDISHILILFTAGFTMLSTMMVSLLLIFRGFSLGFSIAYFTYAIKNGFVILNYPLAHIVLYSVISAVIAVIMIHLSVKTAVFSDEFKSLCGVPRRIVKSKAVYLQLLRYLIALGAIFILNFIRCVL